jgi:hypothetical protein
MNHLYFTEQLVADHRADLIDHARRYRLFHRTPGRQDSGRVVKSRWVAIVHRFPGRIATKAPAVRREGVAT